MEPILDLHVEGDIQHDVNTIFRHLPTFVKAETQAPAIASVPPGVRATAWSSQCVEDIGQC